MSKIWLISGSNTGLGRSIALKVLQAGHQLVATARDVSQLDDLVSEYSGQVKPARVDVTNEQECIDAVGMALSHFGRLDVLVMRAMAIPGHLKRFGKAKPWPSNEPYRECRVAGKACGRPRVHLIRIAEQI
jgi:NADP-dependent 3-hydroxy acid dehydrogenase YdfG